MAIGDESHPRRQRVRSAREAVRIGAGVCGSVREAVRGDFQRPGRSDHNNANRIGMLLAAGEPTHDNATAHAASCRPRTKSATQDDNKTKTGEHFRVRSFGRI